MHEETTRTTVRANGDSETVKTIRRHGSGLSEFCLAIIALTLALTFMMLFSARLSNLRQQQRQDYGQTKTQTW